MNTHHLSPMSKLEIVINGDDVASIDAVLRASGAVGYTVLGSVAGLGHSGFHQGSLYFNDRDTQRMVVCVVAEDRVDGVVEALREFFRTHAGVLFVSPTFVSRPEYFQ